MRGLAILLLSAVTAFAADAPANVTPWANKFFVKDNPPAVIAHDFGTVPHGTVLTHKLTVTNIYDVPMQIIDVRKSCTCLEATVPQQVLQPHETAEVVLVMNAGKFTGANAQSFFITFGPKFISTAVIKVSANSRSDVTLSPGQANFGVVAPGTTPSQTISVKYSGKQKDWKITGAVAPSGPLDVQVMDNGRSGLLGGGLLPLGGPEFTVTVAVKPGAAPGSLAETVTLKTNDPTAPTVLVSVAGAVQAPVTVSPAAVNFGTVKLGQSAEQKVMVRAAKPFTVQALAETPEGLSLETFPIAGPVQIVTVKLTGKAAGKLSQSLTLKTDLGPVTVAVEAEIVP